MAKEKFLIVAVLLPADCFGRFSETENIARIDAGAPSDDPYSWIEASFEVRLIRWREATHLCSFTPSAWSVWLENAFVGIPNAVWERDGDPDGLERESGDETGRYITYRDEYDPRFIVNTFTLDTMALGIGRKPRDSRSAAGEAYHDALWNAAEDAAHEVMANGCDAPIFNVFTYRQWERDKLEKVRQRSLEASRRGWSAALTAEG